jgi:hypothetical protein
MSAPGRREHFAQQEAKPLGIDLGVTVIGSDDANLRKIGAFLANRAAEGRNIRELPSRRRTRSLSTWAPKSPATVATPATEEATDDPDPPLTA